MPDTESRNNQKPRLTSTVMDGLNEFYLIYKEHGHTKTFGFHEKYDRKQSRKVKRAIQWIEEMQQYKENKKIESVEQDG